MRLNSALVSTFLLASAALADFHREKGQPPILNRVEKLINGSIDSDVLQIYNQPWAGLMFTNSNLAFSSAAATFIVPDASGDVGSGFYIKVGIDGLNCPSPIFAAGLLVNMTDNGVLVTSWGTMSRKVRTHPFPLEFEISPGNEIRVSVSLLNSGSGFFSIVDFTTRKSWSDTIPSDSPLCQQNVEFIITVLPGDRLLASFGNVTFKNLYVKSPEADNPSFVFNIQKDNQPVTYIELQEESFTVKYLK